MSLSDVVSWTSSMFAKYFGEIGVLVMACLSTALQILWSGSGHKDISLKSSLVGIALLMIHLVLIDLMCVFGLSELFKLSQGLVVQRLILEFLGILVVTAPVTIFGVGLLHQDMRLCIIPFMLSYFIFVSIFACLFLLAKLSQRPV